MQQRPIAREASPWPARAGSARSVSPIGAAPGWAREHGRQQRLWRQRPRLGRAAPPGPTPVGPLEHLLLVGQRHAGDGHHEDDARPATTPVSRCIQNRMVRNFGIR